MTQRFEAIVLKLAEKLLRRIPPLAELAMTEFNRHYLLAKNQNPTAAKSTTPDRVAVIVNPNSAHGRTGRRWPQLEAAIRAQFGDVTVFQTSQPRHGIALTREALRAGYTRIVSVGGDGSHFEVANGFFDNGTPINPDAVMAILPHGTGSDLPRTLGLPRKFHAALPHAAGNKIIAADLGHLTYTTERGEEGAFYFQNTCHIGIGAEACDLVNRNSKAFGGFSSYLWATLRTLARYRDREMCIEVDGTRYEQVVKELIIAKGRYDAGGMHVAPHARLDNGLFDVYIIGRVTLATAFSHLHLVYRGEMMKRPDLVRYLRGREVKITSPVQTLVAIDGEVPGKLPATLRVVPAALRIVVGNLPNSQS